MQFKFTDWTYSTEVEQEEKLLDPGYQHLHIENAEMVDDIYTITVRSIEDESAVQAIRFYLNKNDGQPNRVARNTLVSLGKALAGEPIGIPFFEDIVGGIVGAEVKLNEYNGKQYRNIYKFDPCDRNTWEACKIAGMNVIDQYVTDE